MILIKKFDQMDDLINWLKTKSLVILLFIVLMIILKTSVSYSQPPIYMLEGTIYREGNRPWYVYINELIIINGDSIYSDSLGRYFYPVNISDYTWTDRGRYHHKKNLIKIEVRGVKYCLRKIPKKKSVIRYFDIPVKSNSYKDKNLFDLRYKFYPEYWPPLDQ